VKVNWKIKAGIKSIAMNYFVCQPFPKYEDFRHILRYFTEEKQLRRQNKNTYK